MNFDFPKKEDFYPTTIEMAARSFYEDLVEEDKRVLKEIGNKNGNAMNHIWFQTEVQRAIRNKFGLWTGNQELLNATGKEHPDDASGVIFDRMVNLAKED